MALDMATYFLVPLILTLALPLRGFSLHRIDHRDHRDHRDHVNKDCEDFQEVSIMKTIQHRLRVTANQLQQLQERYAEDRQFSKGEIEFLHEVTHPHLPDYKSAGRLSITPQETLPEHLIAYYNHLKAFISHLEDVREVELSLPQTDAAILEQLDTILKEPQNLLHHLYNLERTLICRKIINHDDLMKQDVAVHQILRPELDKDKKLNISYKVISETNQFLHWLENGYERLRRH